jgi:hypothetical protein
MLANARRRWRPRPPDRSTDALLSQVEASVAALVRCTGSLDASKPAVDERDRIKRIRDQLALVVSALHAPDPATADLLTQVEASVTVLVRRAGLLDAPTPAVDQRDRIKQVRDQLALVVSVLHGPIAEQPPSRRAGLMPLIEVRDRVAVRHADTIPSDWVDDQLRRALAALGVSVIDDSGRFNESRHEVVDVRQTGDESLHEHIAATVREGYRTDTELLRPQQVVAWVRATED